MLFAAAEMLAVLVFTGGCYGLGRLVTALVSAENPLGAALAAPLGAALLAVELWTAGALGVPWNRATLLSPPILAMVMGRHKVVRAITMDAIGVRRWWVAGRGDPLGRETVLALCALFTGLCLYGLVVQPLQAPDAVAIWMFKAKLFFFQSRVDLASVATEPGRHLEYPPFYPLIADALYIMVGGLRENLGKAAAFPFVLALPVGLMVTLASTLGRRLAGLFTLVAVSSPLCLSQVYISGFLGYADYAQGVAIVLALGCLYRAETSRAPGDYGVALLAAGLTAMIKQEGMVLALAVVTVCAFRLARAGVARRRSGAVVAAAALLPALTWKVIAARNGYHTDLFAATDIQRLLGPALIGRAILILGFAVHVTSFLNDFGWILVGAVLAAELLVLRRGRETSVVAAVLFVQLAAYFLAYLFTPYPLEWHLSTSFDRVVLQLVPSLVLLLALAVRPVGRDDGGRNGAGLTAPAYGSSKGI